jgi:hypothetical protein
MTVILTGYKRGRRRDENGWASVGNNRRRRRSVQVVLRHGEKRREAGRGPVKPEGGAHLLYGPGRGMLGPGSGKQPVVMALMPLKIGQLNEGLGGGLKGGIKAGE